MNATQLLEEWRSIPGYEGYYEVSNVGQVRSVNRTVIRSDGQRRCFKGQPRGLVAREDDRYSVSLWKNNQESIRLVHTLVLEAFVGPRPDGYMGCHRNGIPTDNRIENLYWGTPSQNSYDTVRHGHNKNAIKTHCKRSHEFTAANTYVIPTTGSRQCRKCMHITKAARAKNKERQSL